MCLFQVPGQDEVQQLAAVLRLRPALPGQLDDSDRTGGKGAGQLLDLLGVTLA